MPCKDVELLMVLTASLGLRMVLGSVHRKPSGRWINEVRTTAFGNGGLFTACPNTASRMVHTDQPSSSSSSSSLSSSSISMIAYHTSIAIAQLVTSRFRCLRCHALTEDFSGFLFAARWCTVLVGCFISWLVGTSTSVDGLVGYG